MNARDLSPNKVKALGYVALGGVALGGEMGAWALALAFPGFPLWIGMIYASGVVAAAIGAYKWVTGNWPW